ncbi:MAG: radical SAM protein [Arcicella sp.]|nr:radical SAM protein [Arcicella sp.]
MQKTVFAITPPFTQLNTPYPATAYIKGFLNTKNISCFHADLGIEVILALFSKSGLEELFASISLINLSENAQRIIALQDDYIQTIDAVISFLQGKNPTLSHVICQESFLPEGSRFAQLEEDLDWAFGSMGTQDKAKHLATLYLEDLSDLIMECVDPHFGFSRYAERLGRSANSFDELYGILQQEYTYVDKILIKILAEKMAIVQPKLVAISVPFPGNLYSAFRIGQWMKKHYPKTKIAMGGGFPNTELRSLSDTRVFEFFDFITLDDGEAPLDNLMEYLEEKRPLEQLKRTFILQNQTVKYINNSKTPDYKQSEVGTPDYSDLLLDKYISVIEIVNPMHRMWSDGRWNKLTMAHGCYWGKCTFCDISLDYIKIYEPVAANLLCDRMEEMIAQTGQNGFHFVDEAAPPALMRALALEILRRKLAVSWWTNIRFEKSFSHDLCQLLKASGCIAVSGGLEVASDRLLELIQKGVTVSQVAQVTRNFTEAGIMVHAYLMYGFPTQTAQETIDSLEMVRQMFELGILQSGFWHQFAMTAHSPVGMYPEQFGVKIENPIIGSFANNDLVHNDPKGTNHDTFSYGLKKSLFNFMQGIGFDLPLQEWFEFKIPRTKVSKNYIEIAVAEEDDFVLRPSSKVVWLGNKPLVVYSSSKKGDIVTLNFHGKKETFSIKANKNQGDWLAEILGLISPKNKKIYTFQEVKNHYENAGLKDFELFWYNKPVNTLSEYGLLVL